MGAHLFAVLLVVNPQVAPTLEAPALKAPALAARVQPAWEQAGPGLRAVLKDDAIAQDDRATTCMGTSRFDPSLTELEGPPAFLSDDGAIVCATTPEGPAVWDVMRARLVGQLGHSGIRCVAYNADHRQLITSDGLHVTLWGLEPLRRLHTFDGSGSTISSHCIGLYALPLGAVLSPDGSTLLSVDQNGTACWWNTHTGELLEEDAPVDDLGFTVLAQGSTIVARTQSGQVLSWDAATQGAEARRHEAPFEGEVPTFELSDDGRHLLSANGSIASIQRLDSAAQPLKVPIGNVAATALTADGRLLATATNQKIHIWDTATGTLIREWATLEIGSLKFSPDQRHMLSIGTWGADLWDYQTGQHRRRVSMPAFINSAGFSPDGTFVLSGGGVTRRWSPASAEPIQTFEHAPTLGFVVVDQAGRFVLTGGRGGTVHLWEAATGRLLHLFLGLHGTLSADGRWALTGGRDGARLWNTATGQLTQVIPNVSVAFVALSARGERLLISTSDGHLTLHDHPAGAVRPLLSSQAMPISATFSPDGQRIISVTHTGTRVWDAATGALLTARPSNVTVSPDGRRLLVRDPDGAERLFDIQAHRTLRTFAHPMRPLGFSPRGTFLTVAHRKHFEVIEAATGRLARTLKHPRMDDREPFHGITLDFDTRERPILRDRAQEEPIPFPPPLLAGGRSFQITDGRLVVRTRNGRLLYEAQAGNRGGWATRHAETGHITRAERATRGASDGERSTAGRSEPQTLRADDGDLVLAPPIGHATGPRLPLPPPPSVTTLSAQALEAPGGEGHTHIEVEVTNTGHQPAYLVRLEAPAPAAVLDFHSVLAPGDSTRLRVRMPHESGEATCAARRVALYVTSPSVPDPVEVVVSSR